MVNLYLWGEKFHAFPTNETVYNNASINYKKNSFIINYYPNFWFHVWKTRSAIINRSIIVKKIGSERIGSLVEKYISGFVADCSGG